MALKEKPTGGRSTKVVFEGAKVLNATRNAQKKARVQLAKEIERDIKRKISIPYPPASRKGAHPHLRTGRLKQTTSVRAEGTRIVVRTTNYGAILDTPDFEHKRPFIRRNVLKKKWVDRFAQLTKKFSK